MLTAFMENFTFSGEVNVEIACRNATRYVVLHASRVAVEKVQVAEDRAAGAVPVAGFFLYPQTQVLVVVLNRTLDAQRNYNLKIIYNALIENELLGFFRSSYVLHGERRYGGEAVPHAAPPCQAARMAEWRGDPQGPGWLPLSSKSGVGDGREGEVGPSPRTFGVSRCQICHCCQPHKLTSVKR
jgi:hypothetical protein